MRVLFATGGTGGHINPALAAAQELKSRDPDAEILFVGTKNHMEAELVPKAGFRFESIRISGFQRSLLPADLVRNALTVARLLFVTGACKKILNRFRPDVVVGFGGYVSGPVVRTAHRMGIRTAIHEQNAFPGKTNIALAKYADAVMLTSMNAAARMKSAVSPVLTGLPVRQELLFVTREEARRALGIDPDIPVVLATGGSLGAESINRAMCDVIARFRDAPVCFLFGYGQLGGFVPGLLAEKGITELSTDRLRVSEYIYDMANAMAAADLVVSRAGASSLAEIQAMGKASVLVPSPYVAENHQYHNAMALAEKGAAFVIEQKDLTSGTLGAYVEKLLRDPEAFRATGRAARGMAITDAQKKICDIIVGLGAEASEDEP